MIYIKKLVIVIIIILISVSIYFSYNYINKLNTYKSDTIDIYDKQDIIPVINEVSIYPIENKLSLFMVGDMLLHNVVYNDAFNGNIYDFSNMIEYLEPIASDNDLNYYNQETIIGGKTGFSSYPRFNSPEEIGNDMLNAGFNLVSLANNHTLDKNEQGVNYSVNFWNDKEAVTSGSYLSYDKRDNIAINEINNITYAFLAYTESTNGLRAPYNKDYLVNVYSEELVKKHVESVRDKVDVVIVSMHFGTEYVHNPTTSQINIANYLASLDVDIVIGTHPHVIQPIDYIDDTLVIYSLGNLVSAQDSVKTLIGLMAEVKITKIETEDEIEIKISNVNADLHYTYYNKWKDFKIIPFGVLTNDILNDSYVGNYRYSSSRYGTKEELYSEYIDIVTSMNDNINIVDMYND